MGAHSDVALPVVKAGECRKHELVRSHWRQDTDDLRALIPLVWEHVNPYSTYQLDLGRAATARLSGVRARGGS